MDSTLETVESVFKVWMSYGYLKKYVWKNAKKNNVFTVTAVSQCRIHPDCRTTEQCHTGTCLDACRVEQCGTNAICTSRDHSIICTCPPNYTGDARIACYPSEYIPPTYLYPLPLAFWHHSALKFEKQCYEKRPITPKKIGTSQNCTFVSNFRTLWNAAFCLRCLFTVTPTPVDVVVGCSVNEECPEYAACLNGACRNPCAYDDPCAPNAFCKTIFHTAKCACPDGYIGDPQIECKLPRKIEIT